MFEVHPDDTGKWLLYHTGDGGFDLVAWFAAHEDAEFAKRAFEDREGEPAPQAKARNGATAQPA